MYTNSSKITGPKVTVLMTVYNDEAFVSEAIESILNQTFCYFEFVIIDDGSNDSTPDILKSYAHKDERIKVFWEKNSGTTVAANYGLSLSSGEYVARIDSDDRSFPFRLATEVEFLDSHPSVALVGGGAEIIDRRGNVVGVRNIRVKDPGFALKHRCIYQQSDTMFRRDVVLKLGGYREKFRNAQDYDLWLRISECRSIAKLDIVLGQWRLNGGGYTLARAREQKSEVKIIKAFANQRLKTGKDGYANYLPAPVPSHRAKIPKGSYDLYVAVVLLKAGRHREARAIALEYVKSGTDLPSLGLLIASFMPRFLLQGLFSLREVILNSI